jgi:hypothetical protein
MTFASFARTFHSDRSSLVRNLSTCISRDFGRDYPLANANHRAIDLTVSIEIATVENNMGDELPQDTEAMSREELAAKIKADGFPAHYIKSNYFRVIHMDGAWGSVTPSGNAIQMVVFSHRLPIPKVMTHEIAPDGSIVGDREVTTLVGIVREMEAAMILDLQTAKNLHKWLSDKIDQLTKITEEKKKKIEGTKGPI